MKVKLLTNASKSELAEIKETVGKAFVTNELFHEFGDINGRKELVMKYMDIYTDYVYESNALYVTDDHKGIVGFIHSKKAPLYPQMKMLFRLLKAIPFRILKKYMSHIKQIADSNKQYATKPHIDILLVCVDKEYQGKGYARYLVGAAKKYAESERVPLLFDI